MRVKTLKKQLVSRFIVLSLDAVPKETADQYWANVKKIHFSRLYIPCCFNCSWWNYKTSTCNVAATHLGVKKWAAKELDVCDLFEDMLENRKIK